jgi:hypothetical protein
MAPPTSDVRRPAEARPHPPTLRRVAGQDGEMPDLRSMLATLLAVSAILTKSKAAAWAASLVLLSAVSNVGGGADLAPCVSALPAVCFAFLACYRPPPGLQAAGSPLEALAALFGRRKQG